MPKYTANYGLIKPLPTDLYDVNVFNENADKIDDVLKITQQFSKTLPTGTDLNTVTTSGFYRLNGNHANSPEECYYGQLLVLHGGGDTIAQVLVSYKSSSMWVRSGNPTEVSGTGSWHDWKKMSNTDDVPGQLLFSKHSIETTSGGNELDELIESIIADMGTTTMRYVAIHDLQGYSALTGGTSFIAIHKYNDNHVVLSAFKYGGVPFRIRTKVSGVWGDWQSAYTTNNKPTLHDLGIYYAASESAMNALNGMKTGDLCVIPAEG